MGARDLYAIRTRNVPGTYNVFKADFKFDVSTSIYVIETSPKMTCDCPGFGRRGPCRHVKMFAQFKAQEAIDNPRLWYSYDQNKWFEDNRDAPEF